MKFKHGGNVEEIAQTNNIKKECLLDFSANINPLGYPEGLEENLNKHFKELLKYPDYRYAELRKYMAQKYDVNMQNIIVGNGGIQIIHQAIEFLDCKKALIISPTFIEYEKALRRFNKDIVFYYLEEENDFTFDIKRFKKEKLDDIDLVICCNPNNPTGKIIGIDVMEELTSYLKKQSVDLLIDEAFIEFCPHQSALSSVEKYDNLIITRSLTKFFAVPGLRLGFLVTSKKKLLNKIRSFREDWSVNALAMHGGMFLLEKQDYISETLEYIERERVFLLKKMKEIEFIQTFSSSANYIFFRSIPTLKKKMLKKNIIIRQCDNYRGLDEHYYRIAVRTRTQNEILVNALKEIGENI